MATIATHNGSSVSRGLNLRKEEIVSNVSHIDPDGIHETWCDIAPRQAYEQLFGQAVDLYNAKQTRADRKITNYYNEVRDDQRRHEVYEMIIGIYPEDSECVTDDTTKVIMQEFVSSWSERNPNLALIGAYYHADGQGRAPHVHIDYIPVAHGYKRGSTVQNGLVKALGEMGFEKIGKLTAQIQWEKRENEFLEQICNSHGIIVDHPQVGKGVKHLPTPTYKALKDLEAAEKELTDKKNELQKIQKKAEDAQKRIEVLEGKERVLQSQIDNMTKTYMRKRRKQRKIRMFKHRLLQDRHKMWRDF